MDDKKKVEAVLFTTGKFMSVEDVGKSAEIEDLAKVKNILEELRKKYEGLDSALVIQAHENKYKLNIRKEYGYIANKLVATAEMEGPTVKTLALIAFKNPAMQSDIIKTRGNKAYDHITTLKEQGLITAERYGRTRLLKLTPQFYDYFDTAAQDVKEKFKEIEEKAKEIEAKREKQDEAEKKIEEREKEEMVIQAEKNEEKTEDEGQQSI